MNFKHKKTHYFLKKKLFFDLTNFEELEQRISSLPKEERGDAFEVFAEAYFNTQCLHQAEEVWPCSELPHNTQLELGLPSTDMGIDGVFKTRDGKYHAYQVKYRANRLDLNWEELSTFMGLSDKTYKRVLFTNSNDISYVMDKRSNFYSIKGNDLDRLDQSDFQMIENWLKTGLASRIQKTPFPHQSEAIKDILTEFEINDRTTAIMACGTGKTLVALWVAEKIEAQTILVLLPSLALVRQTLHDWAKENSWDKFNYLCVCSDPTVIKGIDETILHQHDLDFLVTTQKEVVEQFLQNQNISRKIIFSTYQSCQIVADAMPKGSSLDLAIFDEAHKTASRQGAKYAFALKDENLSIKKRLFLTATPRHYNVNKKDKEGNQRLVFSMDDQKTYGKVAHQLSFIAAAKKRLISNYKVIISIVTSEMVNRELLKKSEVVVEGDIIKAQRIANILATQSAIDKYGIKRIFSFHNSVRSAKSFTANTNEGIGAYLEDFTTLHVNGDMSTSSRETILKTFKAANKAIISNARCLIEGVNVPVVDMVAFVSPKKSKVDIIQAAGRAMRKADEKEFGYILLPLFVQIAENESLEQALEKTKFDTIWDVLQAMQEQDESLVEIIGQMREERGKTLGYNDNRLREKVEILGPEICINELRKAVTTKIIDKLGSTWDERFGELVKFKELYGHCNVSQNYPENPDLGSWVSVQRRAYNKRKISERRINRLETIGFDWDPLSTKWDQMFLALCEYCSKKGNCDVPQKYPENQDLGSWVSVQRLAYKVKRISLERVKKLESIGFKWNQNHDQWEEMFVQLCEYCEKNGNCLVPRDFSENIALATWVSDQRKMYNKRKLSQQRIAKLESVGFEWDPLDKIWDAKFAELCKYREEYGDNPPSKFSEYHKLAIWMQHQRIYYREGRLSAQRIAQLKSINFDWDPLNNIWNTRFTELRRYYNIYGDFNVPPKYQESPLLLTWIRNQRTHYKQKKLSQERIALLESIGFIWNPLEQQWETMFNELCKYREDNNHANVPKRYEKNPELGRWCQQQRNAYKNERISQDRIKRLESIGFIWDPMAEQWERMFIEICKYREIYGNCNVLNRYPQNRTLGLWVLVQRRTYKEKKISHDRINKLESIGFDWDPLATAWELKFAELCKYREIYGDCNVSSKLSEYKVLWRWAHNQRSLYKKKKLEQDRIEKLSAIDFTWEMKS